MRYAQNPRRAGSFSKKHAKKEKTCKAPITSKVGARLWVRNIAPPEK
jgi:hypothetical protein